MTIHEELSLSVFDSRDDLSADLVRALQPSLPGEAAEKLVPAEKV
jgi:hypothetical protein